MVVSSKRCRDWSYHELAVEGLSSSAIAARFRVSKRTVELALSRVRREIVESRGNPVEEDSGKAWIPRLSVDYGSSCKPLARLECRDVHPCPRCKGEGYRPDCCRLEDRELLLIACEECGTTGVGPLEDGSARTCGVCYASGLDFLPTLYPFPLPAPESVLEPTSYAPPEDGLRGGL